MRMRLQSYMHSGDDTPHDEGQDKDQPKASDDAPRPQVDRRTAPALLLRGCVCAAPPRCALGALALPQFQTVSAFSDGRTARRGGCRLRRETDRRCDGRASRRNYAWRWVAWGILTLVSHASTIPGAGRATSTLDGDFHTPRAPSSRPARSKSGGGAAFGGRRALVVGIDDTSARRRSRSRTTLRRRGRWRPSRSRWRASRSLQPHEGTQP